MDVPKMQMQAQLSEKPLEVQKTQESRQSNVELFNVPNSGLSTAMPGLTINEDQLHSESDDIPKIFGVAVAHTKPDVEVIDYDNLQYEPTDENAQVQIVPCQREQYVGGGCEDEFPIQKQAEAEAELQAKNKLE